MKRIEQIQKMDAKEMGKFLSNINEQTMNDEFCQKLCPLKANGTCPVKTNDGVCKRTVEENVIGWLTAEVS